MALDEALQFFITQVLATAIHVHNLHKPTIRHERPCARGLGQVERLSSLTHDHAESSALDVAMVPLKLLEPRLQVQSLFLYLERRSLVASVARSRSLTLASRSSISIALAAWLKTLSAARRRQDGGELGSIMIFSNVDAAAAEAC